MPIYDTGDTIAVKKPADERMMTKEEAAEWIRCAEDINYWAENYVWVTAPEGLTLFKPRTYQDRIIRLIQKERYSIIQSGRQTGKTETLAVLIVHSTIFRPDYRVGVSSYTQPNTDDFRDRIGAIYENLPAWMKPAVRLYNSKKIHFVHNSVIMFQVTSAKTFRGKSLHMIVLDELAHVEPKVADDFFTALLPSMTGAGTAAKTKLVIISTPAGTSGKFAEYWYGALAGENGFGYTKVEYEEIPNRGEEFERQMLTKMSRNKFNQEFRCMMISDKGTLINSQFLEKVKTRDPFDQFRDMRIYVESLENRKLMMAADVAEGIGQDNHAFQVFDVDTLEQVAEYHNNVANQTAYVKDIIRCIEYMFNKGAAEIYYGVENNGVGNGVLRLLESSENGALQRAYMISNDGGIKKNGLVTSSKTKAEGCAMFKDLMEMERLTIHSAKLKNELQFFVKQGNTFKAERGMKDDMVMACIIMMNLLKELSNYEDEAYSHVHEIDDSDDEGWADIYF